VIAGNPKQVEQYKGGKTTVIGFLVGQVMKASRGQANPASVNELLKAKLGEGDRRCSKKAMPLPTFKV
jgi:aspartyl-tRNA(Asn)/glutamyl-tRNA(Gln) amidotransferase subunit B